MIPKGFGYRGGGRKGLAARSSKTPKVKVYKKSKSTKSKSTSPLPKLGFK